MRILIVDDEPEILAIVSRWLSKSGHEVVATSDPGRAIDLVQTSDFNVVLMI